MTIDRLIYDALAAHRSVSMPETGGTLEVKRLGAKKISDTQLLPPRNEVVFTSGEPENAVSVVSLAAVDGGVGEEEAAARYASWLEEARREDGTIEIDKVGELDGNEFAVAEELLSALNPEGEEPVYIEEEKGQNNILLWLLIAILLALVIAGGFWWYKSKGGFVLDRSKDAGAETVITVDPKDDLSATNDSSVAGDATTAGSSANAAQTSGSGPRFHVIAGAFAIESNADNFIARLKREYPELTPEKVVNSVNGYNMVSILQTPTRREASRKMNLWWDIDFDLWIFEQK